MKNDLNISELSQHLFWDVDIESLDSDKHKSFIIQFLEFLAMGRYCKEI